MYGIFPLTYKLDAIENTDSPIVKEILKERESERAKLQFDLAVNESRRMVRHWRSPLKL